MTDPIAEGVKLEDAIVILREGLRSDRPLTLKERLLIGKIIDERAALTAAGEMAGERPGWKLVPVEPTNDMVDAGLEEDNWVPIEIYRAMIAAAPASPVVEDVVERMVRAFKAVLLDIDFLIERGHLTDIRNDMIYVEARAALAAIGER